MGNTAKCEHNSWSLRKQLQHKWARGRELFFYKEEIMVNQREVNSASNWHFIYAFWGFTSSAQEDQRPHLKVILTVKGVQYIGLDDSAGHALQCQVFPYPSQWELGTSRVDPNDVGVGGRSCLAVTWTQDRHMLDRHINYNCICSPVIHFSFFQIHQL